MDEFDATGRFTAPQGTDPRLRRLDGAELLTRLHRDATAEVLDLLEAFFTNAEDALFELAYRSGDDTEQQRCFDLMRQMRERRSTVQQVFASMLQRAGAAWLTGSQLARADDAETRALHARADALGDKCSAHFSLLLDLLRQRAARLTPRPLERSADLPIAPSAIARAFLVALEGMHLDSVDQDRVQGLFTRYVMDRLGPVYGHCHVLLVHAGVPAGEEETRAESLATIGGLRADEVAAPGSDAGGASGAGEQLEALAVQG